MDSAEKTNPNGATAAAESPKDPIIATPEQQHDQTAQAIANHLGVPLTTVQPETHEEVLDTITRDAAYLANQATKGSLTYVPMSREVPAAKGWLRTQAEKLTKKLKHKPASGAME